MAAGPEDEPTRAIGEEPTRTAPPEPKIPLQAHMNHLSPVRYLAHERDEPPPQSGIGLCLSGGGYRAMLFHVGALWRLNEARLLPEIDVISSVSGGSIAAGILGSRWRLLRFVEGHADDFEHEVVRTARSLAGRTLDVRAALAGLLLPGTTNDRLAGAYRRAVFDDDSLATLPSRPRFVFNATNLQSGALWEFSRDSMGDYRVGYIDDPRASVAEAVAASSAFPPFLSPARLHIADPAYSAPPPPTAPDLSHEPYTTAPILSDGGVYDNLGLEQPWKRCRTVMISDAGGHMGEPKRIWALWPAQMYRVLQVIDNQVRALRKRQAISGFTLGLRNGTYWGIRSHVADFPLDDPLPCPPDQTLELAEIHTRLAKLPDEDQKRLINWGYAIADVAIRAHLRAVLTTPIPQARFPYPAQGVG
jgi:NTE family protein